MVVKLPDVEHGVTLQLPTVIVSPEELKFEALIKLAVSAAPPRWLGICRGVPGRRLGMPTTGGRALPAKPMLSRRLR